MTENNTPAPAATPTPEGMPATAVPSPTAAAAPIAAPVEPPLTGEELISIEEFAKFKFRVAVIESVEAVPKSNKLLKLQVDVGPLGKRQILAGIAKFYTPEALIGRKIVIVANLKPAKLMGLESQGMLLAASTDDLSALGFLTPEKDMPAGAVVR